MEQRGRVARSDWCAAQAENRPGATVQNSLVSVSCLLQSDNRQLAVGRRGRLCQGRPRRHPVRPGKAWPRQLGAE